MKSKQKNLVFVSVIVIVVLYSSWRYVDSTKSGNIKSEKTRPEKFKFKKEFKRVESAVAELDGLSVQTSLENNELFLHLSLEPNSPWEFSLAVHLTVTWIEKGETKKRVVVCPLPIAFRERERPRVKLRLDFLVEETTQKSLFSLAKLNL